MRVGLKVPVGVVPCESGCLIVEAPCFMCDSLEMEKWTEVKHLFLKRTAYYVKLEEQKMCFVAKSAKNKYNNTHCRNEEKMGKAIRKHFNFFNGFILALV